MHNYYLILFSSISILHLWSISIDGCVVSESKNVQEKSRRSSLIVLTKFLGFLPNQTDPRLMLIAQFQIEKNLKSNSSSNEILRRKSLINLPLYRGHLTFSKQMWCLNDRMVTPQKKYILFLNYSSSISDLSRNSTRRLENMYEPEKWNQKLRRFFIPNANDRIRMSVEISSETTTMAAMEEPIEPIFELEIDCIERPLKKAEIEHNSGVHLRCTVKGEAQEPGLFWLYGGSNLTTTSDGIQVETDNQRLVSNLRLTNRRIGKGGVYECQIKRKSDGKICGSRLRIVTKAAASNGTIFGEVFCGPEKEGYCQNGGTCLFHPSTRVYSCRCRNEFMGRQCEYSLPELDVITTSTASSPASSSITQGEYQRNVTLIGGLLGFVIISLIIAFLIYVKKRFFREIKTGFRRLSTKSSPNNGDPKKENGMKSIEDEERLIDGRAAKNLEKSISQNNRDQRLVNQIIQSLKTSKCPHCHRSLGINGNNLHSITERLRERHSTPHLSVSPAEGIKSKKSVDQSNVECRDCASMNKNRSTPDQLQIDSQSGKGKSKKQRHAGISDDVIDLSPVRNDRKSKSSPVSPSVSLCQLHSAQLHQRPVSNGATETNRSIATIEIENANTILTDTKSVEITL